MKKQSILVILTTVLFFAVACNNGSTGKNNGGGDPTTVNAETPYIQAHPGSEQYNAGTEPEDVTPLSVTVRALTDDGELSYQWYEADSASGTAAGTVLEGERERTYKPTIPASIEGALAHYYYYVVVTNTNDSVNGEKTATARSNTATITVRDTENGGSLLPLTFKVNDAGDAFIGVIAGSQEVVAALEGGASIGNAKRLESTEESDIQVLHTNSAGYADLGDTVGMALKTVDAWTIETYVFLDSALEVGGDISPQIFGIGASETAEEGGPGIWAHARGPRFQIRPDGMGGGLNVNNDNLYTAGANWPNTLGQWRHFVFTFSDSTKREMNVYMDGVFVMGFVTGAEGKTWLSTKDLALMPLAYLGKPINFGNSNAGDIRTTSDSQYHSFTIYEGYKTQAEVTAMVDQDLLDTLNGPHGIAFQDGLSTGLVENAPEVAAGATIATITAQGAGPFTFALVNGAGDNDNAEFVIDGNTLKVGSTALTHGNKTIRIQATDANGVSAEKVLTLYVDEDALPGLRLRFTFESADGDDVAAETGDVTGTLVGGATLDTEYGIGVLSFGGNGQYFDMGQAAANIINHANEYTISTYLWYTYTTYENDLGFWTFTYDYTGAYNNATDSANRSLTTLLQNGRRLTANVASPPEGGAGDTDAPWARNWHMGPQQQSAPSANPPVLGEYPRTGTWNHLMVTHKDTELKIYLNGVALALEYGGQIKATVTDPDEFTTPSASINKLTQAWLGKTYINSAPPNLSWMVDAKYADFRIYNKALDADEIDDLKTDEIEPTLAILNDD